MKNTILFILIIIIFTSCETWDYRNIDELNYGNSEMNIDLFVEGGITTQLAFHKILLSKPGNYVDNSNSEGITNADVYIVSSQNDTINFICIDTVWTPYFKTINRVKAEIGQSYTLYINYNGKTYTAKDSVIEAPDFNFNNIPIPHKDESAVFPNDTTGKVALSVVKHDFGYPQSNSWLWIPMYRYSDTLNYIEMSYFKTYTHWRADIQGVFSNITYYYGFAHGLIPSDTILVIEMSLSDNYYNYLRALFMETDWKEGYFSSQPGNLPTNLSAGAIGYFYTSDCFKKEITISEIFELTDE